MNIIELLISKKLKISTAESCTGGMIAEKITDISGSSSCFEMGVVTYSNDAKNKLIGVEKDILMKYGAVSEQTAIQMANGVKKLSDSDISIAVTGIAGPTGGTEDKPVGLVYVAIAGNYGTNVKKLNINGNRAMVRQQTTKIAMQMAEDYIMQFYTERNG